MDHVHDWRVYKENAEGFHSKRGDNESIDVMWYVGYVESCRRCPKMVFRAPGKIPVEVTIATDEEVADALRRTALAAA